MNRALPALILLLGTLGGSIVALGVARDLERVNRQPESTVGQNESAAQPTPFAWPRATPRVVIRNVSLSPQPYAAQPPLRYETDHDLATQSLATISRMIVRHTKILAALPEKTRRIVDHPALTNDLKKNTVPANKTIVAETIPTGYVAIGPDRKLVQLQYRGDAEGAVFSWTGELHYGASPQRTLGSTFIGTLATAHRAAPLPWDKVVLWSADRRAVISALDRAGKGAASLGTTTMKHVRQTIELLSWTNRQIDRGWIVLAARVKRDLWLVMVPEVPSTLRSAELPQAEKR